MRRLARTGLALVGLAMAAPVNVWADPPAERDWPSPAVSSPADPATGGVPVVVAPGNPAEAGLTAPSPVMPSTAPETGPGSPLTLSPPSPADSSPAYMPPRGLANMSPATPTHTYQPPKATRSAKARASAKKTSKHRWSLLRGRCHCPDCQRAAVLARDGVSVPPPPPVPSMAAAALMADGRCATCEAQGGQVIMQGPAMIVDAHGAPGRAVVGGNAPGYAVVGEGVPAAEPMPIGVVGARLAGTMQPMPAAAAPRDSMLTPSSMSSDPVAGPGHNRPHIISHIFFLDGIGKRSRIARERSREERHASIPYGPQAEQKVTELPASMVYGRGAH